MQTDGELNGSQSTVEQTVIKERTAMKRIFSATFGLTLAALLSACAIPYETPEARANIERDLKINSDDIVTITGITWCLYPYGDMYACSVSQGLGVLTKTKLVLALYKSGIYQQAAVIRAIDVQCAQLQSGRAAADTFYLFSEHLAAMLTLIPTKGALALEKKAQVLGVLVPPSTESFTGAQGGFIEETGRKNYSAVAVSKGIYVGTSQSIMRLVNPCTQGKSLSAAS